ncbi:MAG: exopolysaccharide biosynthesis polyprenyl glycosylphosphotransferase [Opitutales bacterium]
MPVIGLPWNYAFVSAVAVFTSTFGSPERYEVLAPGSSWGRFSRSAKNANFQSAVIAFFVFAAYFATEVKETSRLFLGFFIGTSWPALIFLNSAIPAFVRKVLNPHSKKRISVILGDGQALDGMKNWIERHCSQGFEFAGVFITSRRAPNDLKLPMLGHYSLLNDYLREHEVHQVVVVPDEHINKWIPLVSDYSHRNGCRVLIYNSLASCFESNLVFVEESGRQFFSLQNEPLESPFNQMTKRIFDLALSVPVLVAVLPVFMILVGVAHRLQSQGPLFFKQKRVGLGGRKFVIWKFRSMTHHDTVKPDEATQAIKHDTRVFAFGRFMRRFSIDELPQFINVFRGDMSLVGPRPYLEEHDHLFQRDYKAYRVRQFVKPGVTGPAQCRGLRGEFTDPALVRQRIELDFDYVGSWSLWLDCEILLRTIRQVVFPPKTAY